MEEKVIKIMLGGPENSLPEHWSDDTDAIWIGVDYGASRLIQAGIEPQIAIGDFDSVTNSELDKIKKVSREMIEVDSQKNDSGFSALLPSL